MTADTAAERDRGPRTLTDVVRDLHLGIGREQSQLKAYMSPGVMHPFIDRARTVEQQVRNGAQDEIAFIDDLWFDHTNVVQTELNRQLGLDHHTKPVHTRQVESRVGPVAVDYRDPKLASVTAKDGSQYQWYFRRIRFPEQSPVLSVPELGIRTFRKTDPDQLVLRPKFPS